VTSAEVRKSIIKDVNERVKQLLDSFMVRTPFDLHEYQVATTTVTAVRKRHYRVPSVEANSTSSTPRATINGSECAGVHAFAFSLEDIHLKPLDFSAMAF
jgi:hypothetical protein